MIKRLLICAAVSLLAGCGIKVVPVTAPHLHFEILLDGEAVDPLTMVEQPS